MRGLPLIRENCLGTMSYLPHVKEAAIKGHMSCRDTMLDIEESLDDQFHCIYMSSN